MKDPDRTALFYKLVWPHAAIVQRVARVLTHSASDGEDLSQETMLKAFRAIDSLHDPGGVKHWLLTILRNCQIDRARAQKPEVSYEAADIEPETRPEPDCVHTTDPAELLESFCDEEVIHALRKLPEEIRWTLLLVDVEGLNDSDAAGLLEVPVGTIKSRLHRGRRMLYQSLLPVAQHLRLHRLFPLVPDHNLNNRLLASSSL